MDYSIIDHALTAFYSVWADTKSTGTAAAKSDPPNSTDLKKSADLPSFDSRCSGSASLPNEFYASVLNSAGHAPELPKSQEISQSTPLLIMATGQLSLDQSHSVRTEQEKSTESTERKKDESLPLNSREQKYEQFKNNMAAHHSPTELKKLFNYVLAGWDVSEVTNLSLNMKACLCVDAMQKAVERKEITLQDVKEKNGTNLLAALKYWSKSPQSQMQLTFLDVFHHPEQALFFMQNRFIRDAIFEKKLEKSEFLSWHTTVMEVLAFPTVQKGLIAGDFKYAQVADRAFLLARPFHPMGNHHRHSSDPERKASAKDPTNLEFYAKAGGFSCPLAYYLESTWGNKLTLKDCVNADPANLNKLKILLEDDDGHIAGLVMSEKFTLTQLLALPEEKLVFLNFKNKNEAWQIPKAIRKLDSGELTADKFIKLPLSELTYMVIKS